MTTPHPANKKRHEQVFRGHLCALHGLDQRPLNSPSRDIFPSFSHSCCPHETPPTTEAKDEPQAPRGIFLVVMMRRCIASMMLHDVDIYYVLLPRHALLGCSPAPTLHHPRHKLDAQQKTTTAHHGTSIGNNPPLPSRDKVASTAYVNDEQRRDIVSNLRVCATLEMVLTTPWNLILTSTDEENKTKKKEIFPVPMQNLVLYNRPPAVRPPARPPRCPVANTKNTLPKSANSSFAAIFLVGGILKKKALPSCLPGRRKKEEEEFLVKRAGSYLHNETPTFSCFSS